MDLSGIAEKTTFCAVFHRLGVKYAGNDGTFRGYYTDYGIQRTFFSAGSSRGNFCRSLSIVRKYYIRFSGYEDRTAFCNYTVFVPGNRLTGYFWPRTGRIDNADGHRILCSYVYDGCAK